MAKKDKYDKAQPNAPELQQILQQPSHNPYYPDVSAQLLQPPPYSELTVPINSALTSPAPMSQVNRNNWTHAHADYPRQASVVIHHPQVAVPYDSRAERYHRRISSFNNYTLFTAIMAVMLSIAAYRLYSERLCLFDFTVLKDKDVTITIKQVREAHLTIAYGSGFIILLCLAKSATGQSRSYSCYLLLIGISTFIATLSTGYLAYLAFYSPCSTKINGILTSMEKTVVGMFSSSLPAPERSVFGETSVFSPSNRDDRQGVLIFLFDLVNFILYCSAFLKSTLLC